jgi:hypothetical protein
MSAIQLDSFKMLSERTIALKSRLNPDSIKLIRSTLRKSVSKAELDAILEKMKADLDSLSEMGEMLSLRLQMAMDRLSKMMSTLANLFNKISRTSDAIIQNLK